MDWLIQNGPDDPKHRGFIHPFVTGIISIVITFISLWYASDWVIHKFGIPYEIDDFCCYYVGSFMLAYYFFLIGGRYTFMGMGYYKLSIDRFHSTLRYDVDL